MVSTNTGIKYRLFTKDYLGPSQCIWKENTELVGWTSYTFKKGYLFYYKFCFRLWLNFDRFYIMYHSCGLHNISYKMLTILHIKILLSETHKHIIFSHFLINFMKENLLNSVTNLNYVVFNYIVTWHKNTQCNIKIILT